MSDAISVRLPDFTAHRLDQLSRQSQQSKTDLIVQGLESVFASQLDRKVTYLTDAQFEEVLDFLNKPVPHEVKEKITKTMNVEYPWNEQK